MDIKDVTKCAFFAVTDPKLLTVDFAQLDKKAAERREQMDTLNPPIVEGLAKELQRLRRELFSLQENAKHSEIYCNEQANRVRLIEQQITDAINRKKAAVNSGNALAERNFEHTIARLERERDEAEREFVHARKASAGAAATLKEWPHHARLEELKKLVG